MRDTGCRGRGINIAGWSPPDQPVIPGAVKGVLDLSGASGDILVQIPVYADYSVRDAITLSFGGKVYPVRDTSGALDGYLNAYVPSEEMSNGSAEVLYTAVDLAQNGSSSDITTVVVRNAPHQGYAAPSFPDYPTGAASRLQLCQAGGVTVRVDAGPLLVDDELTVFWEGYSSSGAAIPEAARTLLRRVVTAQDKARTLVDSWADMYIVLAGGAGGYGLASYSVMRGPAGARSLIGTSGPARLGLTDDTPILLAAATSGATTRNANHPFLLPANRLWLAAGPFTLISLSVEGGAVFDQGASSNITIVTDRRGLAVVDLYYQESLSADKSCVITAKTFALDLEVYLQSTFVAFYKWGSVGLLYYSGCNFGVTGAYNTYAIWAYTMNHLTNVECSVSGSALVCAYDPVYTSQTHLDASCTFTITATAEETIAIRVGSSSQYVDLSVPFKLSPFAP